MSWKLPSASTMPFIRSMVMRTKHAVTEASPMVKAKDERRERRDDFANETADDAEAGDSEE